MQVKIMAELHIIGQNTNLDGHMKYLLLKCLRNWLDFAINESITPNLKDHSLLKLALESTEQPELSQKCADCFLSVLDYIQDITKNQELV